MIFPFPAFLISVDNGDFPVPATLPESPRGPQPRGRAVAAARRKGHPGRDFSRDRCDMYGFDYIRGYVWIKKCYKMENLEICNHH